MNHAFSGLRKKRRLRIVKNGHPALRTQAEPITVIDESVRKLARDMTDAMLHNDVVGVGLAAPQVGISKRLIIIDTRADNDPPAPELSPGELLLNPLMPVALVNPVIVSASEETLCAGEGCLSLPGVGGDVTRPAEILLKATLLDGSDIQCQCGRLLARCLQHEIDHLDAVLFVDRIPDDQREKALPVLKQLEKDELKRLNTKK